MEPILTIAIPTYNRKEQIQKQVRLLLPQLDERVKLVVYDNHSDIPVEILFTENELSQFILIRNIVNIGGDANIARCFECCQTKWLWTLSDDDWVKPEAVNKVLQYVLEYENKTFINLWSIIEKKTENSEQFLQILSDRSVFSAAFAMSTCLYNLDCLKIDLHYYYKYLSSMLGTLIMVIKNIIHTDGECVFLNDPPVILGEDVGWNYRDYIYCSSLFLEAFHFDQCNKYKKTIFLGYHKTNYKLIEINRESSNINRVSRLLLFCKASHLQGFFNALIYCPKDYIRCLLFVLIGNRLAGGLIGLIRRINDNTFFKK